MVEAGELRERCDYQGEERQASDRLSRQQHGDEEKDHAAPEHRATVFHQEIRQADFIAAEPQSHATRDDGKGYPQPAQAL
ncbi:MAG: hypothetical protein ABS40_10945 [Agrobacterium sp. SCN 61-19]|nr:MAG: hypothetical protein ABS40_10945 [Agrobacterium sp. SCN 61-19]